MKRHAARVLSEERKSSVFLERGFASYATYATLYSAEKGTSADPADPAAGH